MRPSSWAEYTMMVRTISGLDAVHIWERLPLAEGRQYQALWWQSKRFHPVIPGSGAPGLDLTV